jgi:hypothetical protein
VKLSIDLHDPEWRLIPADVLAEINRGCLETLHRLGNLKSAVEAFRVVFASFGKSPNSGPVITVHFSDPLGRKSSHMTDFRFIGDGKHNPTSEEIVNHLCREDILPKRIREFLGECERKLREAKVVLLKITS